MVLLPDDRSFWSKRIEEHMAFIYWYVYNLQIKQVARSFYNRWRQSEMMSDLELLSLAGDTLEFQNQIQVILNDRKWIGAFFPAWMEHITEELEYAIDKVAGNDISDEEELLFWDDVVKDHAGLDARMLDPSEKNDIAAASSIEEDSIAILEGYNSSSEFPTLLNLSFQNINNIINFHERARRSPPKSIIHPLLLHHVQEEEKRGRRIISIIANRRQR